MASSERSPSRVMVKLSGEAFTGEQGAGIDWDVVEMLSKPLVDLAADGTEVAVVVGAGNLLRGSRAAEKGMERATADYAGMLATAINALVLQDTLERLGADTRLQSAIEMRQVAEPFVRRRAIRHLEKGRIVIFAAGSGNPFFTTDTAAVLRALEINASLLVKATNVDGVYDSDPRANPDAKLFPEVSFDQALRLDLRVMDSTAFSLAKDNNLPIVVVNVADPNNIRRAARGEPVGTLVRGVEHG